MLTCKERENFWVAVDPLAQPDQTPDEPFNPQKRDEHDPWEGFVPKGFNVGRGECAAFAVWEEVSDASSASEHI